MLTICCIRKCRFSQRVWFAFNSWHLLSLALTQQTGMHLNSVTISTFNAYSHLEHLVSSRDLDKLLF